MVVANMIMPNCCDECPILNESSDYPTCGITHYSHGYNFPTRDQRMPDCPLTEVNLTGYVKAQIAQSNKDRPDFLPLLALALKTGDISMKDLTL